jgi:Flp pilus assembly protein TadD
MTPLPGLIDGLRMAFEPMVVPIDSVFLQLTQHQVEDSAAIQQIARDLQSRYSTAVASLGIPDQFPERALDVLGAYSLNVKHPGLAVTFFQENRDHYPHSANAHESLGEGLAAVGDTSHAVAELRTSVSLAEAEMRATDSILVWAMDRDIIAAARAALHDLHQDAPPTSSS